MTMLRDRLQGDIESLTEDGCRAALQYLIGYNTGAVESAVRFVKEYFPERTR